MFSARASRPEYTLLLAPHSAQQLQVDRELGRDEQIHNRAMKGRTRRIRMLRLLMTRERKSARADKFCSFSTARMVAAADGTPASECAPAVSIATIPPRGATLHAHGAATLRFMNLPSTDAPMTAEERIDTALAESFPASDPPWWSLGVPTLRPEAHVTEPAPVIGRS
jgi:hypothetical protein